MDKVQQWFAALPEAAIEAELKELRDQRRELSRQIEMREQALAMKKNFAVQDRPAPAAPDPATTVPAFPEAPPFRGRDAIRRVIAQTPEKATWTIPEMLAAIRERGWIANTHAVQVNLSRMYRDGELGKASLGVYVAPHPDQDLPASDQEAGK